MTAPRRDGEVVPTFTAIVAMSDGALLWTESTRRADAPVMVFLHGGPGLWDYLGPVAALVEDQLSTVRYDQRGCGRSSSNHDQRMARFVADLDELREHVGVQRWWLFGHSFGATLALAYAAAHPDRVAAMVLADGTGLDWADFRAEYHRTADARRTPAQQRRLDSLTARARTDDEEVERRVLNALPDFAAPATAWTLAREDAAAPFAINVDCNRILNDETDAVGPAAQREQCARATMPVLVVHGVADPRPIGGVRRLVDALPNARLVVLPGCGHQPWREDPDRFRGVVASFIGEVLSR